MPRFTLYRLDTLAFAALVAALIALWALPREATWALAGFALQALGAAAWLMRRAVGNRKPRK